MDLLLSLRRVTDEPEVDTYTDSELSARLSEVGATLATTARDIWREKMAAAASLVNISEGGSSRGLDKIYDRARQQFEYWQLVAQDEAVGSSGAVLRRITR